MEFQRLEQDLAVHQKLPDEPNDVGGLSAQELKAKFDEAALAIQGYLNDTHLPQVREALSETLEEAKGYADQKLVAVGAGDMVQAVYDPQGLGADVYQYARDEARRALGPAARFGYVALGNASGTAANGGSAKVTLVEPGDPRGMWRAQEGCFVVPEGATWMGFTVGVCWAREHFGTCGVRALVNGKVQKEYTGPGFNNGNFYEEVAVLPVAVRGGDRVELEVFTTVTNGNQAQVTARTVRGEVLM